MRATLWSVLWLASLGGAVLATRVIGGSDRAMPAVTTVAAPAVAAPAVAAPTPAAPPAVASPAYRRAVASLAAATVDGVWSEADREALRAAVRALAPDESHALYAQLLPRINAQQLRVDSIGPPI